MKKFLTKLQEETLQSFFAQPVGASYFLTGGTALAGFYFNHRESIDLYLILQKKLFTFTKLFKDAQQKDLGLNEFYLAHMLLGVKNLKNFPKMFIPFNKDEMENYFVSLANKLLLDTKPKEE